MRASLIVFLFALIIVGAYRNEDYDNYDDDEVESNSRDYQPVHHRHRHASKREYDSEKYSDSQNDSDEDQDDDQEEDSPVQYRGHGSRPQPPSEVVHSVSPSMPSIQIAEPINAKKPMSKPTVYARPAAAQENSKPNQPASTTASAATPVSTPPPPPASTPPPAPASNPAPASEPAVSLVAQKSDLGRSEPKPTPPPVQTPSAVSQSDSQTKNQRPVPTMVALDEFPLFEHEKPTTNNQIHPDLPTASLIASHEDSHHADSLSPTMPLKPHPIVQTNLAQAIHAQDQAAPKAPATPRVRVSSLVSGIMSSVLSSVLTRSMQHLTVQDQ